MTAVDAAILICLFGGALGLLAIIDRLTGYALSRRIDRWL